MGGNGRHARWCWCCARVRGKWFSRKDRGRHLCKNCVGLSLKKQLSAAERILDGIYCRPTKFSRKRPLIARFLRHHDPWLQLLAEAMLRPPEWVWEEELEDREDLRHLGFLHDALIATTASMPDERWASTLAEVPEVVNDRDQDGWETIPPPP